MFTVSGAVEKTGCIEVPFGMKVTDVLRWRAASPTDAPFKALQQGGPLSGLLPAHIALDLPLEPEPFRPLGAGMGGGGLVFVDDTACVVDLNVMFSWFLEDESCGRCTTCRGGNQRMVEIFDAPRAARRSPTTRSASSRSRRRCSISNCFHGTLSPMIINNTMEYFRDEYDAHALEHRCPAKVCDGLIRYRVANQSAAVAEAAAICPTKAIVQDGGAWAIDDARASAATPASEVAPDDIVIEDKFRDAIPLRVIERADVARAGG